MRRPTLRVLVAALLLGSAAASRQHVLDDEGEITALKHVGLTESTPAAVAKTTAPPSSTLSPSSSFSGSGSSSDGDDVSIVRMPIDAKEFADDENATSGLGSGDGSSTSANVSVGALPDQRSISSGLNATAGTRGASRSSASAADDDITFPPSELSSSSGSGSQTHNGSVESPLPLHTSGSSSQSIDSDVGSSLNSTDELTLPSTSSSSSGSSGADVDLFRAVANASRQPSFVVQNTTHSADAGALKASNSTYASRARASSADSDTGDDDESDTFDTKAPQMHGVPSNPTLVTAVAFDGRAEVSWKTPDDDGADPITEYEVSWFDEDDGALVGTQVVARIASSLSPSKKRTNSSSSTAVTPVPTTTSLPTSTVVSYLLNGRSYTFKVRAKNMNGYSVWSAKSLAVSPLHPPDLCGRVSCSGRGTCFPNYHAQGRADKQTQQHKTERADKTRRGLATDSDGTASHLDAQCICRPGFAPPDCSVKTELAQQYVWKVSEWSGCSSGCGGGKRTRVATCVDRATEKVAVADTLCAAVKRPSVTGICNGMECGSKLVSVKYEVEMSYDEVLFSAEAIDAFELAFTTEVSAALQIPRSRLEITALKRGSIAVFFQILPASRVGEKSLNDIVEQLQDELDNATSSLRSKGTFARRVEPNGVKLSFSIADQSVQGGAEDISVLGLIGTVLVLCFFVFLFGWSLRKRHQRILKQQTHERDDDDAAYVLKAPQSEMKRMGIRTMA